MGNKNNNEKLPESHRLENPNERPDTNSYEVVYAIISSHQTPLEIPFFSKKVSLRNTRRRLESYGYKVRLKKIQRIKQVGQQ